jgi:hypothetical protein
VLGNVDGYVEPERVLGKRLHSDIIAAETDIGTVTSSTTAAAKTAAAVIEVPVSEQNSAGNRHITVMQRLRSSHVIQLCAYKAHLDTI